METGRGDRYELAGCDGDFQRILQEWKIANGTERIWSRDAALWSGSDEAKWLGWLDAIEAHRGGVSQITSCADEIRADGFTDCLLLGMGGSSLCPEVVSETFGHQPGSPRLHVLDSTVPDQVSRVRQSLDLQKTLLAVASKSGSTVEPNVLLDYFCDQVGQETDEVGRQVVAVTDPGSSLEDRATDEKYRAVFHGVPEIGGRFSALSNFGLLPAGLAGLDLTSYLDRAEALADACRTEDENPGLLLGAAMGAAQANGRDKLTLVVSPKLWDIGAWIEQLVAESTGKGGVGICPVDQEPDRNASGYGNDRLFAYIRLESEPDESQDRRITALSSEGHPTVVLNVLDEMHLGAEFYRWEFATAVIGALMEINPFDQPNVQESKDITTRLLAEYEQDGTFSEPDPVGKVGSLSVTSGEKEATSGEEALTAFLSTLQTGDYFTLLSYTDRTEETQRIYQNIRETVGRSKGVATTLGYGPRFLHSTGQLHKGGPNTGVFLQVTTKPNEEVAIPGKSATFGVLSRAQAAGDYEALVERGRRILRVDMQEGLGTGLAELERALLDLL